MQTNLWTKKFKQEGYDIAISSYFGLQGVRFVVDGIPVFPGENFSDDSLVGHYKYFEADVMISLIDVWAMIPGLVNELNAYAWFPVDTHDHLAQEDVVFFQQAPKVRPIAMSRHGRKLLARAGFDAYYVPHGIDTNVYKPLDTETRKQIRDLGGIDADTFVIGICAANKSKTRKAWDEQLQAFRFFHDRHPDSVLYLHTMNHDDYCGDGVDLRVMCHRYAINDYVRFSDQYAQQAGMITPEMMVRWFGHIDLLSAASQGEGFGLPALEAQACGTPVVVTRASAMPEVGKPGFIVEGHYVWNDRHRANWISPDIEELVAAYEDAWQLREKGNTAKQQEAVKHAQTYDVEKVWQKFWLPLLSEVERNLSDKTSPN